MKLLLVNDDSIFTPYLVPFIRKLKEEGIEVFPVLPEKDMSGSSKSFTVHGPLYLRKIRFENEEVHLINGTPLDAFFVGHHVLEGKYDFLFSGINNAANLGEDVLSSGTVGPVLESVNWGKVGIAVSIFKDFYARERAQELSDFLWAMDFSVKFIKFLAENPPEKPISFNINVPVHKPKGVKITKLGKRKYENVVFESEDWRGEKIYWIRGDRVNLSSEDPDVDENALAEGFVSVTPLSTDITGCFSNHGELPNLSGFHYP